MNCDPLRNAASATVIFRHDFAQLSYLSLSTLGNIANLCSNLKIQHESAVISWFTNFAQFVTSEYSDLSVPTKGRLSTELNRLYNTLTEAATREDGSQRVIGILVCHTTLPNWLVYSIENPDHNPSGTQEGWSAQDWLVSIIGFKHNGKMIHPLIPCLMALQLRIFALQAKPYRPKRVRRNAISTQNTSHLSTVQRAQVPSQGQQARSINLPPLPHGTQPKPDLMRLPGTPPVSVCQTGPSIALRHIDLQNLTCPLIRGHKLTILHPAAQFIPWCTVASPARTSSSAATSRCEGATALPCRMEVLITCPQQIVPPFLEPPVQGSRKMFSLGAAQLTHRKCAIYGRLGLTGAASAA